ncbi:MAG: hypothetical protein V3S68_00260, partial [Dehalococcoidia bacterium]
MVMLSAPETTARPTFETATGVSAAVTITKAATPGVLWVLDWVMVSIDVGGSHLRVSLKITMGGPLTFDADFDQAEK